MKNWSEKILYFVLTLTESCWLAAIFLFLNEFINEDRRITIFVLWLAYPFAFLFNRFLNYVRCKRYIYFIANMLALSFSTLLILRIQLYAGYGILDMSWFSMLNYQMQQLFYEFQPEFLIILGNCTFFWRGWSLSKEKAAFSLLSKYFQFGFVMLLLVLFTSHLADVSLPNALVLIVVFSSLVLVGFGLSRSAENNSVQDKIVSSSSQLLLIVVALIVLLGLFIGSFVTPGLLHLILNILKWIGDKIGTAIMFLVNLFPYEISSDITPPGETLSPSPREEIIDLSKILHIPVHIRIIGQRIFVSLFMVGVLVAVYRVFVDVWRRLRRHNTSNVIVESIHGNILIDLLSSLLQLFHYLLNILCSLWKYLKHKTIVEQPHEINSVRQIYRNLLRWGAAGGYSRHISQTPYEYLETMREILPVNEQAMLSQITDIYIVARYGHKLVKLELLQEIEENWKILRQYKLKMVHKKEFI